MVVSLRNRRVGALGSRVGVTNDRCGRRGGGASLVDWDVGSLGAGVCTAANCTGTTRLAQAFRNSTRLPYNPSIKDRTYRESPFVTIFAAWLRSCVAT